MTTRPRRIAAIVAAGVILVACGPVPPGGGPPPTIASVTDSSTPGGDPWGTAFDRAGRVWVAMPGCDPAPACPVSTPPGKLGLFEPDTHTWTRTVVLPSGYGQPLFVAVDGSGKVWFTMPVTNAIGVYDPASSSVRQWTVPAPSSGPWDLTIDRTGKVWFTEHYANRIGSFDPVSGGFREISTPAMDSDPYGIAVDQAGNVWFTENTDAVALIAEYTTGGVLDEYRIRNGATGGTGLTPHLIAIDGAGNPWWSEGWVSAIGTLDLARARPGTNAGVTELHYTPSCGSCGSHTSGIAVDHQGVIWLDDSLQNTFGAFGQGSFSFHASPRGHPHDGLNVDAQNRIWFDEEFGNALAEVIPGSPAATSSNTPGTTSTTSTTTVVSAPGPLGSDTFQRADQALWGTASDGQVWAGDANRAGAFSIASGTGRVTKTGASSVSAVLGPVATNAEVRMTGSLSAFTDSNFGPVLRWADANNWYKAYIDGGSLSIQKKVAGTAAILATVPFAATAGNSYTIDFRVAGSVLSASVWSASGPSPGTPMLSVADSSLTSGRVGMRLLTQGGTGTVTSYQATSL